MGCDERCLSRGCQTGHVDLLGAADSVKVGVDAAARATGTMLTTVQTLIVVATMSVVRPAAAPFLSWVPREMIIAALYPRSASLNLTEDTGANQRCHMPFGA